MNNRWIHTGRALGLLTLSAASHAASFACQGPLSAIERRICASPVLSGLDKELARAYASARRQSSSGAQMVQAQRRWLVERNACTDDDCLKAAYDRRLAVLQQPPAATTDEDTDEANSQVDGPLMMTCHYDSSGDSPLEYTHISTPVEPAVRMSSRAFQNKRFQQLQGKTSQAHNFVIHDGQAAECVYPSGRRVRLKIGMLSSRPYGMCGANPEIFASLWVDERKLDSRIWYAGHCYDGPELSYSILNGQVTKCLTPSTPETPETPYNDTARPAAPTCINFPDTARYPVDRIEYPPAHSRAPAVGDIVRLQGSGPVCDLAAREMAAPTDNPPFSTYPAPATKPPVAINPAYIRRIPDILHGLTPAVFDFDNDGKLDLVLASDFQSNYMDASTLLVVPGNSASTLALSDPFYPGKSWLLPCQAEKPDILLESCPPLSQSQGYDEAGFNVSWPGGALIRFPARYTYLTSFRFANRTFIAATSNEADTRSLLAILEPLPGRQFRQVCLLKTVPENF